MNETLINLFYNAENYLFYNIKDYKPFYEYLLNLHQSSQNIEQSTRYDIENHKIKYYVFKTLNYNNLWVKYSKKLYKDILLFLLIREYTRYDLCITPLTFNIIIQDFHTSLNKIILKNIDNIAKILLAKKRIIINKNIIFDEKSIHNLIDNDYTIIFKTSKKDLIHPFYNILLNIDDSNIDYIKELITYYRDVIGVKKIELELQKNTNIETNNKYRNFINKNLIYETTKECIVTNNDILPCQHLWIENNYVMNYTNRTLKDNKLIQITDIENLVTLLKLDAITQKYIKNECVNCNQNVLCVLGLSSKNCKYKI